LGKGKSSKLTKLIYPKPPHTKIKFCICERCKNPFIRNSINNGSERFCSNLCLSNHRSEIARNNIKLGIKRSKQEIELFDLCDNFFENVTSNEKIANGWDADILLKDHKIAILWNGPWHYREMNFGNHSLKQVQNRDKIKIEEFEKIGWKVLTYEDRYYSPLDAFIDIKNNLL
jgi:hypothetical protein